MPSQAKKFLEVQTPLGADTLVIKSFSGTEQIGRLFQFDLELESEEAELKFEDIIGQKVCVRLDTAGGKRWFHGIVSRFVQTHSDGRHSAYRATVVPWLWLLTRASDCRIFQNETTPDILRKVFDGHGFSDYELRLSGSYQPWEYCVQYRETDFNFVSRLMEQEGIYYFFEHTESEHKLVLADAPAAIQAVAGDATISYRPPRHDREEREETITDWLIEKEVQTGTYAMSDFNFKKPGVSLVGNSTISRAHEKSDFEIFDYPGEYEEVAEGGAYSKLRIEELQAQYEVLRGQASSRSIACGAKFTLSDHPRGDQNRPYLITSTSVHVSSGDFESGQAKEGDFFSCSFTAIPFDQPYRAPRLTPKPMIQGPQTAIVVGPSGEEIHTDEYGRVKLQFHWDRHGKSNQDSSCWVRVTQMGWAGEKWGGIHIPRMGHEVIVEFLEGDPDRPIITGRVYNAKTVVPYDLPANKTQSGIKSRSSKGGTDANFNEIRFEDKKGSEEVYIHAEKNQNNIVENDETTSVGHDRTEDVGHDEKITIGNNRTESVGVNEDITIGSNRTEKVGVNESIDVGSNRTRTVGANEVITVGVSRTHTVGVNEAITIGAAQEVTVGAVQAITVGANQDTNVGVNQSNSVGKDRSTDIGKNDSLKVGKKLMIDAGDEITIKTGEASITMKKDGTIQIKGKDISILGSGKIMAKADSDMTLKGSKIAAN